MESNAGQSFEMVAKTFYGLEQILAKEIRKIGGNKLEILNRAVKFYGDKSILYKTNLYLRTALRILVPLFKVRINSQDELYERVHEYEWEKHLKPGNSIAVDTFLKSSFFTHSHYVSLRTKDAIADRFREKFKRRPVVNRENPDILINVHLVNNELLISLDTSGISLHKRGYRVAEVSAPLNEVLAAGLIMISGWKGETDFFDPMCGSGTVGIEAALIAREIPPGIFRKSFSFENSPDFERGLWNKIFDDIHEKKWDGKVYSTDISTRAVNIAKANARQASVTRNIEIREMAFENNNLPNGEGVAILNPPYGERMKRTNINEFYQMIGNSMKTNFPGTDVWIISSDFDALKHVGLRPCQKLKLYNGSLECKYQKYEIYAGSKKGKYQNKKK
ncbi:MAG: class I SAM-dependent RNA methyltransferase [Bacteroidales bacterium]|nr:class I SAM-dependent RNA methyltransferase [Bacteroidales bacterium]